MNMRLSSLIFLLFIASNLKAQMCDCSSQLSYITTYFEENNPAFQKIKNNSKAYQAYIKQLKTLKSVVRLEKDSDKCIIYLVKYVSLLKDHHSDVGFNLKKTDLGTAEYIANYKASKEYLDYPKLEIDTGKLLPLVKSKNIGDIEGLYSNGGNIVFGIIKKKETSNTYIGVVVKQNKLLDIGHILLELERKPDHSFDLTYNVGLLGFNSKNIFKNLFIENGQISNFGFSKVPNGTSSSKEYEFKVLNDSTNYLLLHSFDQQLTSKLDSFYNSVDHEIKRRPNLIIDIRNNGGGSERSYLNLLPYAYTKPLHIDSAVVWVSPENIRRYEETSSEKNKQLIERMKKANNFTFIPQSEEMINTWTLDSVSALPKKIALLYNRGTASAAEGMILYFMQSSKVITIGENSGGYIGYGNVMTAQTPCGKYTIQSTTTKYNQKSKYEFVGIKPMYIAPKNKDWVSYAEQLLSKK